QFDVGTVVIRESFAPVEAIGVDAPGPYFLGGELGVLREMNGARFCAGIPDAHKVFAASVDEQRHRAIRLVANDTEVFAAVVEGPSLHFREAVRGGETHRILDV